MPRPRNPIPSYRHHRQSGQAVVTIRLADGGRKDVLLGPFGSPESKTEYERLLAEMRASPTPAAVAGRVPSVSVAELLLEFMRHADPLYRDADGKPTRELTEYRQAVRLIRGHYGDTPARDFGPLALKSVRQLLIDAGNCRAVVNRRVGRVKRVFKWAASEELIPVAVFDAIRTVGGLRAGRSNVRDTAPVGPVADDHVRGVLPFVRPEVAAMIAVQRATGMRPGEVCRLRPADVDRSGPVWLYRPRQHKTAWRGKSRTVAIGPKAQALLLPYWPADPAAYVFSPRRAVASLHAARTAARKTPRYPSHLKRNAAKRTAAPKRPPAERYTTSAYGHAVTKGVERANRHRATAALPPVAHWHPNQLRHAYATEVRKQYGLEAAGAGLGHSKLSATEVYAERDLSLALKVAAEAG